MKSANRVMAIAALSFPLVLGVSTTALAATPSTAAHYSATSSGHDGGKDPDHKKKDQENDGRAQSQDQVLNNPQSNTNTTNVSVKGKNNSVKVTNKQENTSKNKQVGDWDDNTATQKQSNS